MSERKIFNFPSIILVELTLEKEGYHPDSFGKASAKFIYAACRFCGEPVRVRKGFYNKAGSACHKECRFKEQSQAGSPFANPEVREKAAQTNLERYGTEHASSNKDIARKISETKKTEESRQKTSQTNLERYGAENVFASEEIKSRIRERNQERYGVDHAMKNDEIKQKTKQTVQERYGVENIANVPAFLDARKEAFAQTIQEDADGKYALINVLRSEAFWDEIKAGKTLKEVSERFNLPYNCLAASVSKPEFKERFQQLYTFPKHQKQNEIADVIRGWGLNVSCSVRDVISPSELDIFIPDKQFAVELNGSYWHSEAVLDPWSAKRKHISKLKKCQSKGIRLVNVFEKTWDDRSKQIMNFIRSSLGCNSKKIDARKCEITDKPCPEFLDDNHVQGYGRRTARFFTLIFDGNIVGTMTAAPHHRKIKDGNPIVLNRLCFADDTTVRGGATRMFSAFRKWAQEEGFDKIISFSDNCLTEGKVYESLGFEFQTEYPSDYFYWDMPNNCYVSKQSQQKKAVACPADMTEAEWAKERGLYRIWDCGKKLWVCGL